MRVAILFIVFVSFNSVASELVIIPEWESRIEESCDISRLASIDKDIGVDHAEKNAEAQYAFLRVKKHVNVQNLCAIHLYRSLIERYKMKSGLFSQVCLVRSAHREAYSVKTMANAVFRAEFVLNYLEQFKDDNIEKTKFRESLNMQLSHAPRSGNFQEPIWRILNSRAGDISSVFIAVASEHFEKICSPKQTEYQQICKE